MKTEHSKKIMDVAEEEGLDLRLRERYSGRFMYGRETHAIVGSWAEVMDAVSLAGLRPSDFRQDQMGLGIVIY